MNHFEYGFFSELSKLAGDPSDKLRVNMGKPAQSDTKKPPVTAGPNLGPGVSTKLTTTIKRPASSSR